MDVLGTVLSTMPNAVQKPSKQMLRKTDWWAVADEGRQWGTMKHTVILCYTIESYIG